MYDDVYMKLRIAVVDAAKSINYTNWFLPLLGIKYTLTRKGKKSISHTVHIMAANSIYLFLSFLSLIYYYFFFFCSASNFFNMSIAMFASENQFSSFVRSFRYLIFCYFVLHRHKTRINSIFNIDIHILINFSFYSTIFN